MQLVAYAEPDDGGHCVRVQAVWSGGVVFSYTVPNGLIVSVEVEGVEPCSSDFVRAALQCQHVGQQDFVSLREWRTDAARVAGLEFRQSVCQL